MELINNDIDIIEIFNDYNILYSYASRYIINEKNLIKFCEDYDIEYDKNSDIIKNIESFYIIK